MHANTKFVLSLVLLCAVWFTSGIVWGFVIGHHNVDQVTPHIYEPPCEEDEVMAVKIDHNPAHGLTWECVNAEQYVDTYNE